MRRWVWLALLFVVSGILLGVVSRVSAENVTVTIGVGDTVLVVTGKTAPQAFVTIKSGDSVIGTTTALADGSYSKTFPAQTPGTHTLSVSAYTSSGTTTDTVTLHISIIEHATTTAELFLPPTVLVEDSGLDEDQPLILKGQSAPLSTIKFFLDNEEYATANADSDGNWEMSVSPGLFSQGLHQFFLRAIDAGGVQSYPTASRAFTYTKKEINNDSDSPQSQPTQGVPLTPPVITFPVSGASWDASEIIVKGTGPKNVQIELWDGTQLLGSVWSDNNGDWSIKLFLQSKDYDLRAKSCLNEICSDFSPVTRFSYRSIYESLYVKVPKTTFTVVEGQPVTLEAEIIHGKAPYKATIHWNDGKTDSITSESDTIKFPHTYQTQGRYNVLLEITDAHGQRGGAVYAVNVREAPRSFPWHVVAATTIAIIALLSLGAYSLNLRHIGRKSR